MRSATSTTLAEHRRQFTTQLPSRMEAIHAQFLRPDPAAWQPSGVAAMHRVWHSLSGSAGTYGMRLISGRVRSLETQLATLHKVGAVPTEPQWRALAVALKDLEQLVRTLLASSAPSLKSAPEHMTSSLCPLIRLVEGDYPEQARDLAPVLVGEGNRIQRFATPSGFRVAYTVNHGERPAPGVMDMIVPEGEEAGTRLISERGRAKEQAVPIVHESVHNWAMAIWHRGKDGIPVDEREREPLAVNHQAIVYITDQAGNFTYVNDLFCDISGYARGELLGQNHGLIISDQQSAEIYKKFWCTISSGEIWQGEICNRSKDGQLYREKYTIVPCLHSGGKPYQYVYISTDISERVTAALALNAARQEAERVNQAKSEFLPSISDELRTPMNAIFDFYKLLEYEKNLSEQQKDYIREILKAGKHLLELINNVLDLAKIEADKLPLKFEVVPVLAVIEKCLSLVKAVAEARDIQLSHAIQENHEIWTYRIRSKQAPLNLLTNTIKYNHPVASVKIEVQLLDGGAVRIRVCDAGPGSVQEHQDKLFQPFNRLCVENSAIEGAGGTMKSMPFIAITANAIPREIERGNASGFHDCMAESFDINKFLELVDRCLLRRGGLMRQKKTVGTRGLRIAFRSVDSKVRWGWRPLRLCVYGGKHLPVLACLTPLHVVGISGQTSVLGMV